MRRAALLALAIGSCVAVADAQSRREPLAAYLANHLRVSEDERTALARGAVVTRVDRATEGREIAAMGVVHVDASAAAYVNAMLDVEGTRRHLNGAQVGRFSNPPRIEDVAALTLDGRDVSDLRHCRVGECDVKLSAEAIERFRTEIAWSAADAAAQANAAFRRMLVELVAAYIRAGNGALIEYADKPVRVSLANEVRGIIAGSSYIGTHAPPLIDALQASPPVSSSPGTDVIYWSKESRSGYKPVVTITHLLVYRPPAGGAHAAFLASKQLYASHYFEGSLGLTAVVQSEASGVDVVYHNRSRLDALRGSWVGLRRTIANRRVRHVLEAGLLRMKRQVEEARSVPY
jgi:hypothetical protein